MTITYKRVKAVAMVGKGTERKGHKLSAILPMKAEVLIVEEMLEQGFTNSQINKWITDAYFLEQQAKTRQKVSGTGQGSLSVLEMLQASAWAVANEPERFEACQASEDQMKSFLLTVHNQQNPVESTEGMSSEDADIISKAWKAMKLKVFGKDATGLDTDTDDGLGGKEVL